MASFRIGVVVSRSGVLAVIVAASGCLVEVSDPTGEEAGLGGTGGRSEGLTGGDRAAEGGAAGSSDGGSDERSGGTDAGGSSDGGAGGDDGTVGGTPSTGGADLTGDELAGYLLDLGQLDEPTAKGPTTVACEDAEGCLVDPLPGPSEFGCGYELTTEVRVAAESLVSLGPDPDLWPGNVLRGRAASQSAASLDAIPLPLGAFTLSSTLNGAPVVEVTDPTDSGYRAALSTILGGQTTPSGTAVASQLNVETAFSQEDLSKTIGVNVGLIDALPLGADIGLTYRTETTTTHARVAVSFVQSYFQVSVDPHTSADEYFANGVTAEDLEAVLDAGDVPVYVRSVTYGRRIVALFEDDARVDSNELALEIGAAYQGVEGQVAFDRDTSTTIQTSDFSAFVLGDDVVLTNVDDLFAYLDEPPDLSSAWPIAYTLQYMGSESPFEVGITTEAVTRTCEVCGSTDPYGDGVDQAHATPLLEGDLSDWDSYAKSMLGGILPPGQERWFTAMGSDDIGGVVDPQASLASTAVGAEVCIFADCESGETTSVCLIGDPELLGTLQGCCSTSGDAQLTGDSSTGLCPDKVSDDARIYARVRLNASEEACLQYDLTVHY